MPKSKPKHTELPYEMGHGGDGTVVITTECRDVAVMENYYGDAEHHAAFLVRAANNHYRLIEAAKDGQETVHENHCSMLCVDTCVAMQTAIREAEKED